MTYSSVVPSFSAVWEAATEHDGAHHGAARVTDGLELLSCGELRDSEELPEPGGLCSDRQCLFPHESASAKVVRDLVVGASKNRNLIPCGTVISVTW